MSKVHKSNSDQPAVRSRSDSFVRMLELEKLYQMQRLQHDHEFSSSTSNQTRASFPSAVTNPPVPRSRRTSDYPPLSYQPQIMKANRRDPTLPALSVSIAPSPTQALTMRPTGSVEDVSLAKEEHAKTVTFSDPDEEDLSDNSSICQSPSWEKWDKKKPKKSKKGDNHKNTKESDEKALKRRSNRLVKAAPINVATSRPTTSDRPNPPPELGASVKSDQVNASAPTIEIRGALGGPATLSVESGPGTKGGRPKSRGFLSGFRSDNGNGSGVRGLMGARRGAEKGANENGPLRTAQDEAQPLGQPNVTRPGVSKNVQKSKTSPVGSMTSGSDNSLSQDKRASTLRPSSSSGHGRSQSLLSSTLNKLRGSYFSHYSSGDDSANRSSKLSNASQDTSAGHGNPVEAPNKGTEKSTGETSLLNLQDSQQSFDFAFSSDSKAVNMEPGPDIAPRGRQPRPRKIETPSPSSEQEIENSDNQRVQIETIVVPSQDAVIAAQDRQPQTVNKSQQKKLITASGNQTSTMTPHQQSGSAESGTKAIVRQNQSEEVHHLGNTHGTPANSSDKQQLNENRGKATTGVNGNVKLDVGGRRVPEDDSLSVGIYASTSRSASQSQNSLTEGRHRLPSGTNDSEAHIQPMNWPKHEVRRGTPAPKPAEDFVSFGKEVPDKSRPPQQLQRDVDFFEYFSEAYVPPVLDLRSPSEHVRVRSTTFPFLEKSDEDSRSGNPDSRSMNGYTKQTPVPNEGARRAAHAIGHHSKEIGQAPNEKKQKDSPDIVIQCSDSDIPTFERLGLSSKATKVHGGAETARSSIAHSQQTDPSRATSERSSSSTCDDSPPSPSSVTTPDSSRPQSRKGQMVSSSEASQSALTETTAPAASKTTRKTFRGPSSDQSEQTTSRTTRPDTNKDGSDWRQASSMLDLEPPPSRIRGFTATPSPGTTPTSASFVDALTPDSDEANEQDSGLSSSVRAQSAVDLNSATKLLPRGVKAQRLQLKPGAVASSASLPSSLPSDLTEEAVPRKSALKTSKNNSANGSESSATISVGGAYLQEARKAAPVATASTSRALRPPYMHKSLSGSSKSVVSSGSRAEPLAKMLVECCNCHFFHDMPSRVYECIAKPDTVVEDKLLGVSAAITRMVKCPWCAHGMTTQCCSGYAAVVYLQEKLHGK
ncbi:hypothetical protein GGS21DRAFT_487286 [Xylaria nigripes]|nr:hypothetical protein GGS21DRAFT_487286 [Xylaria nigripes]